ncbi:MAG: putative oxygen-independent coproporphyrinogen III oxidase [Polyangiales bacterium]|jgi:putative oxygen-independent coproporphyrinogen III oxidase
MKLQETSVYVHFPWCAKKCPYCDFATTKRAPGDIPHDAYADAVIKELRTRGPFEGRELYSVFFGGGTPSLWAPAAVGRVLEAIRAAFSSEVNDVEITAECNPNSLSDDVIEGFGDVGINRLSVGVQSLRNSQLQYLGRLHDRAEALSALERAQRRFDRVSADLMFGMPGQVELAAEIAAAVATGVKHVSAYALTIEPGTQFGERQRLGKLEVASDDTYARLFGDAERLFADSGFAHYEVSNYAQPAEEARHNQHYWRGGDYVGLGAAAVGCLSSTFVLPSRSKVHVARRYKSSADAEEYMAADGMLEAEVEELDDQARIREALMLGLRMAEGVDLAALEARVGVDPLEGRRREFEARLESGDLVQNGSRVRVPSDRWILLDGIVSDLF